MREDFRGLGWPLIFVLCDSLYSVRPDDRRSNSSGSVNVPRATASCGAPVTPLSSFFHLMFWPENLLLSCQLISTFLGRHISPAFLVFSHGRLHPPITSSEPPTTQPPPSTDILKIAIKFSVTAEHCVTGIGVKRNSNKSYFANTIREKFSCWHCLRCFSNAETCSQSVYPHLPLSSCFPQMLGWL